MSDLTLYTITYTYSKNVKFGHGGVKILPLSDFEASGDTNKTINRIVSITCSRYHSSGSSRTWYTKCRLGGSYFSNVVGKHISKNNVTAFTNTFEESNFPPVEVFQNKTGNLEIFGSKEEDGTYSTDNSIDGTAFTWCATNARPLTITVAFYDRGATYYSPSIEQFEVKRVDSNGLDSDQGTYARATIKLGLGRTGASTSATIYCSTTSGSMGDSITSLTSSNITSALSNAIALTVKTDCSSGTTYYFTLEFTAGDEVATSPQYMLPRAFAALHISGCTTGGVAVGGFSSATENNPKFEVHHPAYLYGGIAQIGSGSSSALMSLGVQAGQVAASSISASGYKTADVVFTQAFSSVPSVTTALVTGDSSQTNYHSYQAGESAVFIGNVTTTGFKYVIVNGRGASRNLGFNWVAVGMSTGSSTSGTTGGGDSGGDTGGGDDPSGGGISDIATRTAAGGVIPGAGVDLATDGTISLSATWSNYISQTIMGDITFGSQTNYKKTLQVPLPAYRMLRTSDYGASLPEDNKYTGRIFFLKKS